MKLTILFAGCLTVFPLFSAEKAITQDEYVNTWSGIAVEQMTIYRIPASITLAQGILESGNGNSELAKEAKNHFGIKCHDWKGDKFFMDDDEKGECFRVYKSADESYRDHSLFLTTRTRYAGLFNHKTDDYKSWAKGLKEAGYATDPKYPARLIEIIERLKLDRFDNGSLDNTKGSDMLAKEVKKETEKSSAKETSKKPTEIVVAYGQHSVKTHKNKINYIVAKKGDTYYKIAKEFQLGMWQLYRYNSYGPKKELLEEGDIVYIQPKRRRSKVKGDVFVADKTLTVAQISQIEGIKTEAILEMNNLSSPEETVRKGQRIVLR